MHGEAGEQGDRGAGRQSAVGRTAQRPVAAASLDEIDSRLLVLLQEDATRPAKWLATRLGISMSSVHRRRAALVRAGVIRRTTVTIDCARAGRPSVFLIEASLEREDVTSVGSFERRMRAAPEVVQCFHATGDRSFLLVVALADNTELPRFCEWLCAARGAVLRIRTGVVLEEVKPRSVIPISSASG